MEERALRLRREACAEQGSFDFVAAPHCGAATTLRMTVQQEFVLLTASLVRTLPMSQSRFGYGFAGLVGFEAGVDFVPVDYVPPGGEILRAAVVVFEVVGVLPDVVPEDREMALRDRTVLIGRAHDVHLTAAFAGEPDPSGAELFDAGVVELGLEILEVAEGFGDGLSDGAAGIAAAFGLHDLPEHGVVDVAAAIVAHRAANIFRKGVEVFD